MQDLNDDNFDALLSEHLSRQLDPQLGRGQVALQLHRAHQRRQRLTGLVGLALAASIAAIVLMRPATPPSNSQPHTLAGVSVPGAYQMNWQTIDQGTVFLDDQTPMRKYLRQRIETVRWIDPNTKATIEYSVPHNEIVLIALNTY